MKRVVLAGLLVGLGVTAVEAEWARRWHCTHDGVVMIPWSAVETLETRNDCEIHQARRIVVGRDAAQYYHNDYQVIRHSISVSRSDSVRVDDCVCLPDTVRPKNLGIEIINASAGASTLVSPHDLATAIRGGREEEASCCARHSCSPVALPW